MGEKQDENGEGLIVEEAVVSNENTRITKEEKMKKK